MREQLDGEALIDVRMLTYCPGLLPNFRKEEVRELFEAIKPEAVPDDLKSAYPGWKANLRQGPPPINPA